MNTFIAPALIANASTLGIHWIYDHLYLEQLAAKQDLLFLRQSKEHYDAARSAYLTYEGHELGGVTIQGQMLKWLYQAMKNNPDFSSMDYSKLLYQQFKPGGAHHGYIESYAKKHVLSILAKSVDVSVPELPVNDDHLVGFLPYLVCKELGLDATKAWELTKVYSHDEDYYAYFLMFDELLRLLPQVGMHEAVKASVSMGPKQFQTALQQAVAMDDANAFIEAYSGRACAIKYSIPLIVHILSHTDSYEEAIRYNARLGGAISDRNMLLGALFAQVSEVPLSFQTKLASALTL
jgi:hypothetical protein